MELRAYQSEAIEETWTHIQAGSRRIIVKAPCGAGKTVISSFMIKTSIANNHPVLFLAHRRELIDQSSNKLDGLGIFHGVIMANHPRRAPALPVQVASIQTLVRRLDPDKRPPAKLIVVDEAHLSLAPSYLKILEHYPEAVVIGLTATPKRADGRGLGEIYDKIVHVSTIKKLTAEGYLVPSRVWAPSRPNLDAIKISKGDYDEKDLDKLINRADLVGDIVKHWKNLAGNRQTVVFAVNIAHSKAIRDSFLAAGIKADHVDGTTPADERAKILSDLASGAIQVVSNVGVLTEGWDCPPVSCCVLARPTMSENLFLQMVGRVLRLFEGNATIAKKLFAMILDHAGCVFEHGLPDADREYSLDGKPKRKKKEKDKAIKVLMCKVCFATFEPGNTECPQCGEQLPKPKKSEMKTDDEGSLEEITDINPNSIVTMRAIQHYQRLKKTAEAKDYKRAWVWIKMKQSFPPNVVKAVQKVFRNYKKKKPEPPPPPEPFPEDDTCQCHETMPDTCTFCRNEEDRKKDDREAELQEWDEMSCTCRWGAIPCAKCETTPEERL